MRKRSPFFVGGYWLPVTGYQLQVCFADDFGMGTRMTRIERIFTDLFLLPAVVFHGIVRCIALFIVLFAIQQKFPRRHKAHKGAQRFHAKTQRKQRRKNYPQEQSLFV